MTSVPIHGPQVGQIIVFLTRIGKVSNNHVNRWLIGIQPSWIMLDQNCNCIHNIAEVGVVVFVESKSMIGIDILNSIFVNNSLPGTVKGQIIFVSQPGFYQTKNVAFAIKV